ncbi:MAG: FKBP-type peptidyl-prolyl cis-trans isomerase [bacterium]|nr:FKBP-type peptidyl-prolyl cis-trans isomerase [bacterium]
MVAALGAVLLLVPVYFGLMSSSGNVPASENAATASSRTTDVSVKDFVVGDGKPAEVGDIVFVHYVGALEDGTTFDTSVESEEPFAFQLGAGQVILGWELGIPGMREGGTRRLVIPPELAYGNRAIADNEGNVVIPANSTLVFDVVLMKAAPPSEVLGSAQ